MQATWRAHKWGFTGNKTQSAFRAPSANSLYSGQDRFLQFILQGFIWS